MVRTALALVFIAGVGGGAAFMAQKKTVIKGSVMAADLLKQLDSRGITEVSCDDTEVKETGAIFVCRVAAKDGSRATIEYTMDRNGSINGRQLGEDSHDAEVPEEPSAPRPPRDPNADPWSQ